MKKTKTIYEKPKDSVIEKFAKDFNKSLENLGFHCNVERQWMETYFIGSIYHSPNPSARYAYWDTEGRITQHEVEVYTSNRKVHKFILNYPQKTERGCEEE